MAFIKLHSKSIRAAYGYGNEVEHDRLIYGSRLADKTSWSENLSLKAIIAADRCVGRDSSFVAWWLRLKPNIN